MCRRAGSAVAIAALWMGTVSGCTQLLGIADISAVDGSANVMSGPDAGDAGDAGSAGDAGDAGSAVVDVATADADGGSSSVIADARVCPNDLSFAYDTGFYISFTLQTRQPDGVIALLNQRDKCTLGVFWDLHLINQALYFEISDAVTYAHTSSTGAPLNDDVPHDILITRDKNGLVQLMIDGALAGMATLHQQLGMLPMLRIGTSVCVGEDPNVDLRGTISNVCLGLQ